MAPTNPLRMLALFNEVEDSVLDKLYFGKVLHLLDVDKNTLLYEEGFSADNLYFMYIGEVVLTGKLTECSRPLFVI